MALLTHHSGKYSYKCKFPEVNPELPMSNGQLKILWMPELLFERAFHPYLAPRCLLLCPLFRSSTQIASPVHKARSVLIHSKLENSHQELGDFSMVSQKHSKLQVRACSPPLPLNFPFPLVLESVVYFVNFFRAKNIIFIS